nr:hypothetical protein [Gemmatimonadaceae bacterium]
LAAVAAKDWATAAAIYTGPFLGAWFVRDAVEFEQWADGERRMLAECHATVLRAAAREADASGDPAEAARRLVQLARLDAGSSAATGDAATALARCGESGAALALLTQPGRISSAPIAARDTALHAAGPVVEAVARANGSNPGVAPAASHRGRKKPALRQWLLAGISAVGVPAAIALLVSDRHARADALATDVTSIAVMPFAVEGSAAIAHVADGLGDQVARDLRQMPGVQVAGPAVARGMVSFARTDGRAAIAAIIRGVVDSTGDGIRVIARLTDAQSGASLGAAQVTAPLGDPITLEERLSSQLSVALRRQLGERRIIANLRDAQRVEGATERAIALVWQAQALSRGADRVGRIASGASSIDAVARLADADSLLALAEDEAPRWPVPSIRRAWVTYAQALLTSGPARVLSFQPGIGHAEHALSRIQRLGADTATRAVRALRAEALWVRGAIRSRAATAIQTYRPETALLRSGEADLDEALRIDPGLAGAWASLAYARWVRGDHAGAQAATARALASDAYLENADEVIGRAWRASHSSGDRISAASWCARGRAWFPDDWRFVECRLTVMLLDAAGLGATPDPAAAWALVDTLAQVDPDSVGPRMGHPYNAIYRRVVAATISAAAGDARRARVELQAAERRVATSSELRTDLLYDSSHLLFALGDSEEAEARLAAYTSARPDLKPFLARDAITNGLRTRFAPR